MRMVTSAHFDLLLCGTSSLSLDKFTHQLVSNLFYKNEHHDQGRHHSIQNAKLSIMSHTDHYYQYEDYFNGNKEQRQEIDDYTATENSRR